MLDHLVGYNCNSYLISFFVVLVVNLVRSPSYLLTRVLDALTFPSYLLSVPKNVLGWLLITDCMMFAKAKNWRSSTKVVVSNCFSGAACLSPGSAAHTAFFRYKMLFKYLHQEHMDR